MTLFSRSILGVYQGLWVAAGPVLRRNRRLAEGFAERETLSGPPFEPRGNEPRGPLVWVQAASGGEAALARTLIREAAPLLGPSSRFFCTTWTAQGLEVLRRIPVPTGSSIAVRYFPLDNPELMRRAVALARPACVVLLETEIWPGLMSACSEAGVPLLVLNARMTAKSLNGYRLLRPLLREIRPARIAAVSEADAARFAEIFGPEGASIMPNIKFDGAGVRPPEGEDPFSRLDPALPRQALASVRQEEEEALLGIVPRLLQGAALAVAPRHMHRVEFWHKALAAHKPVLRSQLRGGVPAPEERLLIWDTFGDLPLLYAHCDAAFVGGSLAPLGGQNFLEASARGAATLVGPHLDNFLWVGDEIFAAGLVQRVLDDQSLAGALAAAAIRRVAEGREQAAEATRRRFAEWLAPRTGGALAAAEIVVEALAAASK